MNKLTQLTSGLIMGFGLLLFLIAVSHIWTGKVSEN